MPSSVKVVLRSETIKVTLTCGDDDPKTIQDSILRFLSSNSNINNIIGLDTEWTPVEKQRRGNDDKVDTGILVLCDGDSCLIHRLSADDDVQKSILNFLRLSDYSFVGMGIKSSLEKLEKEHGYGCKNAVEVGEFAAKVMGMPKLSAFGVDELLHNVDDSMDLSYERPKGIVQSEWGRFDLTPKQIKCVTLNVYSYFKIADTLLRK